MWINKLSRKYKQRSTLSLLLLLLFIYFTTLKRIIVSHLRNQNQNLLTVNDKVEIMVNFYIYFVCYFYEQNIIEWDSNHIIST